MIYITKPFLPPKEDYLHYLDKIWESGWLTNNGPLVNELEQRLKDRLELPHLLYMTNGTITIQIAIKALELKGEIITTPFSYVATTSSIVWENATPVFVDIDKDSLNIDHRKIEAAITENTVGILATHVYGNPCEVSHIEAIAKKHKLKVIYDAAHCFGTSHKGTSLLNYGDVSTISFHATKLFHTIEGGAVITPHEDILKKMKIMRNFGHTGPEVFGGVGINAKNSEFHAAMGLAVLKYMDAILVKRKKQYLRYLEQLEGKGLQFQKITADTDYNYAYFPIVLESEAKLLETKEALERRRISPRRYFYPPLSQLSYVDQVELPVCDSISPRVLCLPLYHKLSDEIIDMVCRIILSVH